MILEGFRGDKVQVDSINFAQLLLAIIAGLLSIWAWLASQRTKREQAKFSRQKMELESFLRIEKMYINALAMNEAQLRDANQRVEEQNIKIRELQALINGKNH